MESFRSYSTDSPSSDASMRDINDVDYSKSSERSENDGVTGLCTQQYAMGQFNKNRKIIIRNIPPVTYEEVKAFLGHHAVSNMSISKKSRHAIVSLVHGEEAEDVVTELGKQLLLGTEVDVNLYPHEAMLCVAHLPPNMDDAGLLAFLEPYGAIDRCFLMKSTLTGESKCYGFVEFMHNRENLEKVRDMLHGGQVGGASLHCCFLPDACLSFHHLHSRCVLIEGLPADYNNHMELRNICSGHAIPLYCQVATRDGSSLGWGLVEYSRWEEAEVSLPQIDGYSLAGGAATLRASFCVPGIGAAQMMASMARQQTGTCLSTPQQQPPPPPATAPGGSLGGLASPLVKQLLASTEQGSSILHLFQQVLHHIHHLQHPDASGDQSPIHNPNLQIALLSVLLATQLQAAEPNILGSPVIQQMLSSITQHKTMSSAGLPGNPLIAQASSMLHTLLKDQAPSPSTPASSDNKPTDSSVHNLTQLLSSLQLNSPASQQHKTRSTEDIIKPSLLGDKPGLLGVKPKQGLLGDNPFDKKGLRVENSYERVMSEKKPLLGDKPHPNSHSWRGNQNQRPHTRENARALNDHYLGADTPTRAPRPRPPLLNSPPPHKLYSEQPDDPRPFQDKTNLYRNVQQPLPSPDLSTSAPVIPPSPVKQMVPTVPPPLMSLNINPPRPGMKPMGAGERAGNKQEERRKPVTAPPPPQPQKQYLPPAPMPPLPPPGFMMRPPPPPPQPSTVRDTNTPPGPPRTPTKIPLPQTPTKPPQTPTKQTPRKIRQPCLTPVNTMPAPTSSDNISPSQLNPLAPQFIPNEGSPGSKAVDPVVEALAECGGNAAGNLLAHLVEAHLRQQLLELQSGSQPFLPPTPPSMRQLTPAAGGDGFSKTPGNKEGQQEEEVDMWLRSAEELQGFLAAAVDVPEKKVLDFQCEPPVMAVPMPAAMPAHPPAPMPAPLPPRVPVQPQVAMMPVLPAYPAAHLPQAGVVPVPVVFDTTTPSPESSPPQLAAPAMPAFFYPGASPVSDLQSSSPSHSSPSTLHQSSPHSLLEHTPPHYYSPSHDSPPQILNAAPQYPHNAVHNQYSHEAQEYSAEDPALQYNQYPTHTPVMKDSKHSELKQDKNAVPVQYPVPPPPQQYPVPQQHHHPMHNQQYLPVTSTNLAYPQPVKVSHANAALSTAALQQYHESMMQYHNVPVQQFRVPVTTAPLPPHPFHPNASSTPLPCSLDYKRLPPLPPSPETGGMTFHPLPHTDSFHKYIH